MQKSAVFGKNKEPHTIIIAKGHRVSHFTVKPWVFVSCGAVIAALCVGYLTATSYLIFRDDLLSATMARQARLQHSYEDRISKLRAQVDRITSHRLLDQQVMETKLAELINRQSALAQRAGVADPIMDRIRAEGLLPNTGSSDLPVPEPRPGTQKAQVDFQRFGAPVSGSMVSNIDATTTASIDVKTPDAVHSTLNTVTDKLAAIEDAQIAQLRLLRQAAEEKKAQLVKSARSVGLNVKAAETKFSDMGGPFLPARPMVNNDLFAGELEALNASLDALDTTRDRIKAFPIAHPARGKEMSSHFGNRRDPIIGKTAFHAGLDFRTPTGTPIASTAAGTVIKAGRNGGYGNMVEIRHEHGLTTRYAHLSSIKTNNGAKVSAGQIIGLAGSTGRSTGPHLHYEVRSDGKALNPINFITAGQKLSGKL